MSHLDLDYNFDESTTAFQATMFSVKHMQKTALGEAYQKGFKDARELFARVGGLAAELRLGIYSYLDMDELAASIPICVQAGIKYHSIFEPKLVTYSDYPCILNPRLSSTTLIAEIVRIICEERVELRVELRVAQPRDIPRLQQGDFLGFYEHGRKKEDLVKVARVTVGGSLDKHSSCYVDPVTLPMCFAHLLENVQGYMGKNFEFVIHFTSTALVPQQGWNAAQRDPKRMAQFETLANNLIKTCEQLETVVASKESLGINARVTIKLGYGAILPDDPSFVFLQEHDVTRLRFTKDQWVSEIIHFVS